MLIVKFFLIYLININYLRAYGIQLNRHNYIYNGVYKVKIFQIITKDTKIYNYHKMRLITKMRFKQNINFNYNYILLKPYIIQF